MALPINVFRTVSAVLTDTEEVIYTTPNNNTSIILMAQATNLSGGLAEVTFSIGDVELAKDFILPPNDAFTLLSGKLVVEEGQTLSASCGVSGDVSLTLSVLESRNA